MIIKWLRECLIPKPVTGDCSCVFSDGSVYQVVETRWHNRFGNLVFYCRANQYKKAHGYIMIWGDALHAVPNPPIGGAAAFYLDAGAAIPLLYKPEIDTSEPELFVCTLQDWLNFFEVQNVKR